MDYIARQNCQQSQAIDAPTAKRDPRTSMARCLPLSSLTSLERKHPSFPAFLKVRHVLFAEHRLQRFVPAVISLRASPECVVELFEESLLLQIQAQIARLAVVGPRVAVI